MEGTRTFKGYLKLEKKTLKIFDGDETFASNSTDDNWKSASLVQSGLNIFFSADAVGNQNFRLSIHFISVDAF